MPTQIEGYRLSPLQKHLWLLQQDGSPYLSQCVVRLKGKLNQDKLKHAVESVVERHEILRTTFQRVPGMKLPMQSIAESGDVLRTTLVSASADEHLLTLSLLSLCGDNRSLINLVREIADAYEGDSQRGGDDVVQYLQFSEWQNEVIEDENAAPGREYWRQQNLSYATSLTLPLENAAETREFEPRSISTNVSPELLTGMKAIATTHDTNIATIFLACWHSLAWRLTGHSDVVLGMVDDGRRYEELQGAIGLLARALPLNVHFADDSSFSDVIRQVTRKASEGHDWMEYFNWEERGEQIESPFFPLAFEFIELPEPRFADGLEFSFVEQHSYFDRFRVKLNCFEQNSGVLLDWQYDSSLFRQEDVERLAGQFHNLLTAVIKNPHVRVSDVDFITDDERRHLIVELNQTARPYPTDKPVHQLFEEQAARTPDHIAVRFEDESLTFADLNARANQLAAYLRSLDVGPETTVAIYMERSPEMMTAMLGTLKAGAAYVPLDLAYPKERLAFMLADANVSVLLTQERLVTQVPEHDAREITLDTDWPIIATESDVNPVNQTDSANAAYVIYTSGSTGTPKGVIVTHHGLSNYLSWCAEAYGIQEGSGAPVHSPLGFDLTVTSIFPPLLAGKEIVIVPEEQRFEGLSAVLHAHRDFSLVKITPSHLEVLNQMLLPDELAGTTKTLIIGGEALNNETLSAWRGFAPEVRLINEYGPTETVVGCCVYEVVSEDPDYGPVPIGRPISNTQLFILNNSLRPVPAGVTGELFISGAGVARGYLARPELTADRFLPNPFSESPGTRLYRTGDLARYRRDGVIEYLGRIDQQVKIRGFRIELGEIEAALNRHPHVAEAVVLARHDVPGDTRLVAYLVPQHNQEISPNDVRVFLRELLPEYMVPTVFLTLRALPLTPNGKIDRAALPAPGSNGVSLEEAYVAPRNVLEEVIATIWIETLGIKRVGIHDNFFEVGGHSLLAMQVISRIREEFQVELPVRSFFDGMTVERLAQSILEREPVPGQSEKIARTLKAIAEMPEEELLEMISAQRANEN